MEDASPLYKAQIQTEKCLDNPPFNGKQGKEEIWAAQLLLRDVGLAPPSQS